MQKHRTRYHSAMDMKLKTLKNSRRAPWLALTCSAALLLGLGTALHAEVPADAVFQGFEPFGDLLFELDGEVLKSAEVFLSNRAAAYLIMAPELSSPILISPRTQALESVHLMKVMKREDGTIDLLADAAFNHLGTFQIDGQEVAFEVKGQPARLKPKPALIGFHKPESLKDYKPEYARLAADYSPSTRDLDALRAAGDDVRVLIYFGTWCPTCSRLVPRVLRIDEELAGQSVEFQYYGLPRQMSDDPVTDRDNVHGVPTGIVYRGGKEVGRLGTTELNQPEIALREMLGSG